MSRARNLSDLLDANGDVISGALDNASGYDKATSSTGYLALPAGTTAQRPGSAAAGYTRMNTTTGSVEFYDGTSWIATNLIPSINSITGTIYAGVASTLTLSLTNATDTIDVKYYEGGALLATDSGVTVTSGSATSTVPSAVYGQTAGDTISVSVFNSDGTPSSNSISKTVQGLPTGGTITTSGGYRYHTFTSSSSFVVPSGFSANYDYVVIAGGGGGGSGQGGGGGAGGMIEIASASISPNTYSVSIGGGGASGSGTGYDDPGSNGSNTTFNGQTAIGGGAGAKNNTRGYDGGSGGGGGGGGQDDATYLPTGVSGQGSAGSVQSAVGGGSGGGGGGKSAAGTRGGTVRGNGGAGKTWLNGISYCGGGGGSCGSNYGNTGGYGGTGGGGDGETTINGGNEQNGAANKGGGGGAGSSTNGAGGSGTVVIRYAI